MVALAASNSNASLKIMRTLMAKKVMRHEPQHWYDRGWGVSHHEAEVLMGI